MIKKIIAPFKMWYEALQIVLEPNRHPGTEAGLAKAFGCIFVVFAPLTVLAVIITAYLLITGVPWS